MKFGAMDDLENRIKEPRDLIHAHIFDKSAKEKDKSAFYREVARDGVLALVILVLGANIFTICKCLLTLLNIIILFFTGVDMDLQPERQVAMDVNKFLEHASPLEVAEREFISFTSSYASCDVLIAETGIELAQYEGDARNVYDDLEYHNVQLTLHTDEKYGELTFSASLNKNAMEEYHYSLTGLFAIEDYTPESTHITFDHDKASYIFDCGEGKQAYFVKTWGFGEQTVYFETNGIMYTFKIDDNETEIENAQKLIKIMMEGDT